MNKLFPIAVAILIMLGSALWFLAPSSFNQYLHLELQNELTNTTKSQVEIGHIESQSYSGKIYSITGKTELGEQLFYIEQVTYQVDRKSYKKPPIKIQNLTLSGVTITNDPLLLEMALTAVKDYKAQLIDDELDLTMIVEKLNVSYSSQAITNITAEPFNAEDMQPKALLAEIIESTLSQIQKR